MQTNPQHGSFFPSKKKILPNPQRGCKQFFVGFFFSRVDSLKECGGHRFQWRDMPSLYMPPWDMHPHSYTVVSCFHNPVRTWPGVLCMPKGGPSCAPLLRGPF